MFCVCSIKLTLYEHPEEGGKMEVSGEDERDTPGELKTGVGVMEALDNCSHDPTRVSQDEGQEQVGMDLIPETPHLPEIMPLENRVVYRKAPPPKKICFTVVTPKISTLYIHITLKELLGWLRCKKQKLERD